MKAGDHVVFQMHNPVQSIVDDPPDAFGWFSRGYPSNTSSPSDTDGRMTSEIKEIASVSGNTVTFTTPLSIGYRVAHLTQLTRYTANSNGGNGAIQVVNAGVEDLTMVGGSDGSLRFEVTAYCWAKNIEVTQWIGEGVAINNSFRTELRDSYIHTGSDPTPGGSGYAISLADGSSEVLIENNISRDTNKVMVARSSGTGSVVAYNYMDDGWISYSPTWQEIGLNASHMAGPHHVLFEGNYGFNMDTDYTHGSSQYITYFLNYVTGQRGSWTGPDANSRTAGVSSWAKEFTFIGNVMGRPGQMSGWSYDDPMMGCAATGGSCAGGVAGTWNNGPGGDIWQVGYDATNQWAQQAESGALSTVIRDGNYDYLTNTQRWHNTPGGFTIPNSLYLTSTPAFFGTNPWPWVNPNTGTIYTLPAKARYDAGTPNQVANGGGGYTVTVSASPSNGGTVVGGGTFASGSSDTVAATPNGGYTFANWTQNGTVVSSVASYTFTLTGNVSLVANFTVNPVNYTIGLSASPSAGGTVSGGGTFASGSSQTVTATPNSGYTFTNWTSNGTVVSSAASYTFTLNGNTNLVANFTDPVNYTVAVGASPSSGGTVAGGGTFASGSSDTVTATPNSGYTFANWTENGTMVSSAASYTFALTGNRNLVANFTANSPSLSPVSYSVAVSASPTAGGTVTGTGTFASGSSQTMTATPNSGYTFANWTANGSVVNTSASYTLTLNSNVTLLANFVPVPAPTSITLGETTVFSDQDGDNGNMLLVQDATLSQAATLKSLSFYISGPAGSLRLGIYDATGPNGGPGALKAQTASFTPVEGWNTSSVTTPVSLPSGKYWLAYFPSSNNLQFPVNRSIGSFKAAYLRFGPMPAKFPKVSLHGTVHWSLYGSLQ